MFPPAPPRFSMTKGWPRVCCSPSPKIRVAVSTPPPAGCVTTIFTGLLGKSAAEFWAATGELASIQPAAVIKARRFNIPLPPAFRRDRQSIAGLRTDSEQAPSRRREHSEKTDPLLRRPEQESLAGFLFRLNAGLLDDVRP